MSWARVPITNTRKLGFIKDLFCMGIFILALAKVVARIPELFK